MVKSLFERVGVAAALAAVVLTAACSESTSPRQLPGGPGTSVSIAFCAGTEPNWVAIRDGDGSWTQVQPTVSGSRIRFETTLNADRAAVATARVFPRRLTALSVQYGTPAELAIVGDTNPLHCSGTVSQALLGTVVGIGPNDVASISAGLNIRTVVPPGTDNSFALQGLTPGPQEILATRMTRVDATHTVLTRLILRRSGELPDSTVLPVFDFGSAESFAPSTATLTINGLGPEGASVNTLLRTAHSQSLVNIDQSDMSAVTRSYLAIPESKLDAGDLQILSAVSGPIVDGTARSATLYFRTPGEQILTLGPAIGQPTFGAVATTPALRLHARFASQGEYDRVTTVSFQQGDSTIVSVSMTQAYAVLVGGVYDLVIPDLSHAPGFDSRWALRPGTSLSWTAARTGGTLDPGLDAIPTDGATSRNAIGLGSFTP